MAQTRPLRGHRGRDPAGVRGAGLRSERSQWEAHEEGRGAPQEARDAAPVERRSSVAPEPPAAAGAKRRVFILALAEEHAVIGRLGGFRYAACHRRGLEDRVGPSHRRSGADGARRRSRRGACARGPVAALERWPETGVPDNPGAWLMATAKHRAIDLLRRNKRLERKHQEAGQEMGVEQENAAPDLDAAIDDDVGDDLLRLVFISCHPVLSTEARVALTLRLLGGLSTDEIARAFLVPEPTV